MADSFIRPEELWRDVGLRADQVVVHLGCGAGFYMIPAAIIVGKRGQVIGVDLLSDMLAEAANRARRAGVEPIIRTVRGNLENERGSTLENASADWVLVANVLYQSDPAKIIGEAARIVKPSGSIIIIEWDTAATPMGPPSSKRIAKSEVTSLVEQAGMTVAKEWHPSPYHYGLIVTTSA